MTVCSAGSSAPAAMSLRRVATTTPPAVSAKIPVVRASSSIPSRISSSSTSAIAPPVRRTASSAYGPSAGLPIASDFAMPVGRTGSTTSRPSANAVEIGEQPVDCAPNTRHSAGSTRPSEASSANALSILVSMDPDAIGTRTWRVPRQVLVPMASGSMLTEIDKAFAELASLGLVEPAEWRVFGAQSTGCSPISTAFALGRDVVEPVRPTGIAKSLAIGNPADGPYALDAVRRTGGAIADVDDDEIRDGIELLARTTGIFAETAGGVVVATLRKLIAAGALDPAEQTVIYNTGDGLKTLDAVAGRQAPTVTVKPSLRAAREAGLLD